VMDLDRESSERVGVAGIERNQIPAVDIVRGRARLMLLRERAAVLRDLDVAQRDGETSFRAGTIFPVHERPHLDIGRCLKSEPFSHYGVSCSASFSGRLSPPQPPHTRSQAAPRCGWRARKMQKQSHDYQEMIDC